MSMRHYETVFIVTPVLSDQQIKEAVDKFRDFLSQHGAEVYHAESWGLRKLAYPINKKHSGYYQLFEFKASPELIHQLDVEYRRDERIIRYLTVMLDKYGFEFNEKRRNGQIGRRDRDAAPAVNQPSKEEA